MTAGEEIELGDYVMERYCPHRQADLTVFGEVDGGVLDLHAARLAVRPRDRPLPHRRLTGDFAFDRADPPS